MHLSRFLSFLFSHSGRKGAVVDVQKVFDGYQKVKEARERLEKSSKIAKEEIDIFRDELGNIVKELREMEEKLKNPNIDSSALKGKYQEKVKNAQAKRKMIWLNMRKEHGQLSAQRQKNLLVEHLGDIREAIEKVSNTKKIGFSFKFIRDSAWRIFCL